MERFTTYLSYAGMAIFVVYLIASLALHHSSNGFKYSDTLLYMMYVGVLLQVPCWGYRLWHFRAYKDENKDRLITWGLLAALIILFLIFKG